MSERLQEIIETLHNKQNKIIDWVNSYIDSKFEKPFTELMSSSTYKEYLESITLYKEWKDIDTKIYEEETQIYPDKYRISRLLDKTQELRSKFQNIENFNSYIEALKHKIWDKFCKNFSEELDNHGILTRIFQDFLFKGDQKNKYTYDFFKKILLAKIIYLSKNSEEIIVNHRKNFCNNNIELSKLGQYKVRLCYGNWPREDYWLKDDYF